MSLNANTCFLNIYRYDSIFVIRLQQDYLDCTNICIYVHIIFYVWKGQSSKGLELKDSMALCQFVQVAEETSSPEQGQGFSVTPRLNE